MDTTPGKRRRASSHTPATATRRRCDDDDLRTLCADLGALAAATARHPRFASSERYGSLLCGEQGDDWLVLDATPAKGAPTVLSIDVEMVERRSDGQRLAVSAAIVAATFVPEPVERVVFCGLVDPGSDDLNWKTDIHGISAATVERAAANGELRTVADVQNAVANEWKSLTFLAGHSLHSDLKVLRICGPALLRRALDTALLHWQPRGGAPKLTALTPIATAHDALADAKAALGVVLDDLSELQASLAAPSNRGGSACSSGGEAAPPSKHKAVVHVLEHHVGKLIGKRGATIESIVSKAGPGVRLDILPRDEDYDGTKRRVLVEADDPALLSKCIELIRAHGIPTSSSK